MLKTGSLIEGKYKILDEIGRGGMSVVYLAINERANKTWAVKEIRKDSGTGVDIVRRGILSETEMLKKLRHPHLPSIVDVIDREDCFLIVMDYIEGKNLQDLLEQEGAQPVERVIAWAMQLCDVLGYLHSRKPPIIYRDVKPSNVILRPDGQITLIDFGTAREYKNEEQGDTAWLGTRGYAAPEQFGQGRQTDGRTDIYNLGATMYHLITGCAPAEMHFLIEPVGSIVPALKGSGIEKVIAGCCRQDPEERYQSCEELMYALEHVHEEDDRAIRRRKLRWAVFMACVMTAAAALFAGIGFRAAYAGTKEELYRKSMRDVASAEGFLEKAGACREALRAGPAWPDAWDRLLEAVEEVPLLTNEQYEALMQCLLDTGGDGTRARYDNLRILQKNDLQKYAEVNYRMGMALFFRRQPGGEALSREYFRNALETGALDENGRNISRLMLSLAEQQTRLRELEAAELMAADPAKPAPAASPEPAPAKAADLTTAENPDNAAARGFGTGADPDTRPARKGFEVEEGYRECWEAFSSMAEELTGLETLTGNAGYPIAVCERIADELNGDHIGRYFRDGVSVQMMRAAMENAESYMKKMEAPGQTENMKQRVREVNTKISLAWKSIHRLEGQP